MGQKEFIRQIENSDEFKLLSGVVSETTTVEDAIHQMVNKTMTALAIHGPTKQGGIGTPDYNLSLALMELAQRLEPSEHRNLVEFVAQLQKQVAVDPSTNEPLRVQKGILWTDMPSLGYTELETWYEFGGGYKDPCNPNLDPLQKQRWVKLNAFLAQLTQVATVHYTAPSEGLQISPLDKSLRAIWTLAMTLENESAPETLVDTAAMQATCTWFIHAADRLWENVQNTRTYVKESGAGPGTKYGEKDWMGFTQDRWQVWVDGLRAAHGECTDAQTRELIRDALLQMERVITRK